MSWGVETWAGAPVAGISESPVGALLVASLPALTADLSAISPGAATVTASLPALTADITGMAVAAGGITGSLPALTAIVEAIAISTAVIAAELPALTASIDMATGQRRPIRSWLPCPRPASGFAMSGPVGSLRTGEADT